MMNITGITVRKMNANEERYPAAHENPPFSEVYLLETETSEGPQECPFFVHGGMTPSHAAAMFKLFAAAIERMEKKAA